MLGGNHDVKTLFACLLRYFRPSVAYQRDRQPRFTGNSRDLDTGLSFASGQCELLRQNHATDSHCVAATGVGAILAAVSVACSIKRVLSVIVAMSMTRLQLFDDSVNCTSAAFVSDTARSCK
jgi:hypothetical protein